MAQRTRGLFEIVSPAAVFAGNAPRTPRWVAAIEGLYDVLANIGWGALAVFCAIGPIAVPVTIVLLFVR